MAGNSVIGALRVVLGADTAALDKGLKDAQGSLSRFAAQAKNVGLVAAGAVAGLLGGSAAAIKGALSQADNIGKMAQSIGLPVEELSKLKHVADLSDVSLESLSTSMVRLSKNMSEVAGGATGPAAEAFKSLGISVTDADGRMKSSSVIIGEVADKFSEYEDGANKTALAVALFGRAGAAMIPMLNAGSAAIEEAKNEAAQLGLVISKDTSSAAENFNDNMARLGKITDGVSIQVAARLAPALAQVSAEMVKVAKDSQFLTQLSSGLEVATKSLASTVLVAVYAYKQFAMVIGTAVDAALKIGSGDFAGAFESVKSGISSVKNTALETVDSFKTLWSTPDASAPKAAVDKVNESLKQAPALATGAKNALQSFFDSQAKAVASRNAEAASIGLATGEMEKLKVQQQALLIAQQNGIPLTEALNARIAATGDAAAAAALKLEGMRLKFATQEPIALFQLDMQNAEAAMRAVGATAEELANAQDRVREKFGMTWESIGGNFADAAGSMAQLTGTFAKENKSMGVASKAFGISQAIINTQIAITKALATLPPPASYTAVAAAVAQGAAAVASISAQKFKTGGSMKVPGGIGGGDRVQAMVALEPGEQLDIWRPGDGNEDPRRGANSASPTMITMVLNGALHTKEAFREAIDGFNEMFADGYKLKIT